MIVQLTQFMRPDGRQVPVTTEIADECLVNYEAMETLGGRLTAEVLTTGEVSLCIEHPECGDFDSRIVANGPDVRVALENMLQSWRKEDFVSFVLAF